MTRPQDAEKALLRAVDAMRTQREAAQASATPPAAPAEEGIESPSEEAPE